MPILDEKAAIAAWKTAAVDKGLLDVSQAAGRAKTQTQLTGVSLEWLEAFSQSLTISGEGKGKVVFAHRASVVMTNPWGLYWMLEVPSPSLCTLAAALVILETQEESYAWHCSASLQK